MSMTHRNRFVRYFLKGFYPSGIFLREFSSGNFPNVQFPKRQLPKSVLTAALGPPPLQPNLTFIAEPHRKVGIRKTGLTPF